jgi:hypothetical protein
MTCMPGSSRMALSRGRGSALTPCRRPAALRGNPSGGHELTASLPRRTVGRSGSFGMAMVVTWRSILSDAGSTTPIRRERRDAGNAKRHLQTPHICRPSAPPTRSWTPSWPSWRVPGCSPSAPMPRATRLGSLTPEGSPGGASDGRCPPKAARRGWFEVPAAPLGSSCALQHEVAIPPALPRSRTPW